MPRVSFVYGIDGFAFDNNWTMTDRDFDQIRGAITGGIAAALFVPPFDALALLLGPPPLGQFALSEIITGLVNNNRPGTMGLCGGMASAALDYFKLAWLPQRGHFADGPRHPEWTDTNGAPLRQYIWNRLLDTLHTDGLKFVEWIAVQHNMYPFSGGPHELLNRSRQEWDVIKSSIDSGNPRVIGLVVTSTNPTDQHQVLATGYDDHADGTGVLHCYDNSFPDVETHIDIDFRGSELSAYHHGYPGGVKSDVGPIKGFFIVGYRFQAPPSAMVVTAGLSTNPAVSAPLGTDTSFTFTATNNGFGGTPPLKLFYAGREASDGSNVDIGGEPAATPLAMHAGRALSLRQRLTGQTGLRRYFASSSVEVSGGQAWRLIPSAAGVPGAEGPHAAIDLLVTDPPSAWQSFGGQIISSPSAGRHADGRIVACALGLDSCLWYVDQTAPSNGWTGWRRLASRALSGRLSLVRNGDGRLEVFGRATNGEGWHIWENSANGTWSSGDGMGGTLASDVVAINNADGRIEIFAISTDGRLQHRWQAPVIGWSPGWSDLGTGLMGVPAVGRHPDGRLEVFARMASGEVWHSWQTSAGGSSWPSGPFGGNATADLAVANNADGHVELFGRGRDGALWHRWWTGSNWSNWESLGGQLQAGAVPSVVLNAGGGLQAFVRGVDNAIWHTWQVPTPPFWSNWASLGGTVVGDPVAIQNADGRLELLARGRDGTLVHRWQTVPHGPWNG